jgi:hypothetical protein
MKLAKHSAARGSAWIYLLLAVLALGGVPSLLPLAQEEKSSPQDLLAQADEVLHQMSELTGLPIKAPLQKRLINRDEVKKYLQDNIAQDVTPQEMHVQEAELQAFGLVSRDFKLQEFLLDFYTEQAAGFYDPHRKTMFIADWATPDMQKLILSHELTHALQDQNFDLIKFMQADKGNDDATNTRQAIVEGHATAAMMQQLVEPMKLGELPSLEPIMAQVIHQQFEEYPVFSKAPFFFRMEALYPYIQGMGFMQAGLKRGGWPGLNKLFANPPRATREIFVPNIYFDHHAVTTVSLPKPPMLADIQGLNLLTDNIMGSLGYYALIGQFISEDDAKTLSAELVADRYLLYEGPAAKQYTLVACTRWTDTETALDFFRDYHAILAHKYPELAPGARSASDVYIGGIAGGRVILMRKGNECLWAEGIPNAKADAMLVWLKGL